MAPCFEVTCSKGKIRGFNLLCWCSAWLLFAQGFWILADVTKLHTLHLLSPGHARLILFTLSYSFFLLGCGMLSVSVFGCCCSIQRKNIVIIIYLVKMSVMVGIEVTLIVAALVYRKSVLSNLEPQLYSSLTINYGHKNNSNPNQYGDSVFTQSMDFTQYTFNCCGINSDMDYLTTRWLNFSKTSREPRDVPLTCCEVSDENVMNAGSPTRVVQRVFHGTVEELWQHPRPRNEHECQARTRGRYTQGCLPFLKNWLEKETQIVIIIMFCMIVIQVFGFWFSIGIHRRIHRPA